jgi:hypothetical protein
MRKWEFGERMNMKENIVCVHENSTVKPINNPKRHGRRSRLRSKGNGEAKVMKVHYGFVW